MDALNNDNLIDIRFYDETHSEGSSAALLGINLGAPAKTLVDILGSLSAKDSLVVSDGKVLQKTSAGALVDLHLSVGSGTSSTSSLVNVDGNLFGRGSDGKLIDLGLDVGKGGIITADIGAGGGGATSTGGINLPTHGADVYRFFNTKTGVHFYTASDSEKVNIVATSPTLKYEGAAFQASTGTADGPQVFRFYNTDTKTHFFTASATERDAIIKDPHSYKFEGAAYTGYANDGGGQHQALYRFFNTDTGTHFYTANQTEVAQVKAVMPHMNFEGVAYYVDAI
jgi:hypothetical protein